MSSEDLNTHLTSVVTTFSSSVARGVWSPAPRCELGDERPAKGSLEATERLFIDLAGFVEIQFRGFKESLRRTSVWAITATRVSKALVDTAFTSDQSLNLPNRTGTR